MSKGPTDKPILLPWKTLAVSEVKRLHDRAETFRALDPSPRARIEIRHAQKDLKRAEHALTRKPEVWWRVLLRPLTWVTGTDQETAWKAIHAAEVKLTLAAPPDDLAAAMPALRAKAVARLGSKSKEYPEWKQVLTGSSPKSEEVAALRERLYTLSDTSFERIRSFRNGLLLALVAIAVFAVVLAVVFRGGDSALSFCTDLSPTPTDLTTVLPVAPASDDCPVDKVWEAELLGMLGGLIAAVAALQRMRGFRNPYNLPLVQLALRVPMGALTAVVGLVLVQSGQFVLSPQTGLAMTAFAIFFGAAQEFVTRLIDQKAGKLADDASRSK